MIVFWSQMQKDDVGNTTYKKRMNREEVKE